MIDMEQKKYLSPPFPYFGGKRAVADIVWRGLGNTKNYVEPFFGGGAVLLKRRHWQGKLETVNDIDGLLCNAWRAIQFKPEETAHHASWPVSELDLHARHKVLIGIREELVEALRDDPHFCEPELAGYWIWGMNCWVGDGFGARWSKTRPRVSNSGGVNRADLDVRKWFEVLTKRLRRVRIICGDWERVVTPEITTAQGVTGIFLDPPYTFEGGRDPVYNHDSKTIAEDVRQWAIDNGNDPLMRICLAGYDDGREMPDGWEVVKWKANGGYGNQRNSEEYTNKYRERLWFSPHCLIAQEDLFMFAERKSPDFK